MAAAPAPTPARVPSAAASAWRSGRAWTAELDLALVEAYCRHAEPAGRPVARNFWPAVVRDMDVRLVAPTTSDDPHEEDREACDSSRHRLKRLRQYAAQISLLLNHPSLAFTFDVLTGRVLPRRRSAVTATATTTATDNAWALIANAKFRNRVRQGTFHWYPLLVPHIDRGDYKWAQTATQLNLPSRSTQCSPDQSRARKRRSRSASHDAVPDPSQASLHAPQRDSDEPLCKRRRQSGSSCSSTGPHDNDEGGRRGRRCDPGQADRAEGGTASDVSSPEGSSEGSPGATSSVSLARVDKTKRTWTTERDVSLVRGYMAYRSLIPPDPAARPASSVWRRIVRAVFGALSAAAEREAGDSARHRLRKLKEYGAQAAKLLRARDATGPLFIWDDAGHRLTAAHGRDEDATWNKIRNPQVRNRLMQAHYPWLRLLDVSESDLSATFHSTTLGVEYYQAGMLTAGSTHSGRMPASHAAPCSSEQCQPLAANLIPPPHPAPAPAPVMMQIIRPPGPGSDPAQYSLPAGPLKTMRGPRLPGLPCRPSPPSASRLPSLPGVTSLASARRSPPLVGAAAAGAEEAGSVTRSSRIILADVELGLLAPAAAGREYLLLLPRLDAGQRELFASVREFSPGHDTVRAHQSYALLDTWLASLS